jgi:uncharacterized membrane protein
MKDNSPSNPKESKIEEEANADSQRKTPSAEPSESTIGDSDKPQVSESPVEPVPKEGVSHENGSDKEKFERVLQETLNENPELVRSFLLKAEYTEEHSGPLPSPRTLDAYNNVHPGLAEIIINSFEEERGHRHRLENEAVHTGILLDKRGQMFAFIISILVVGVCTCLAFTGQGTAAASLGGAVLVALAAAFIVSNKKNFKKGD